MAFLDSVDSWRTKAHLGGIKLPILVGITSLVALALILIGHTLVVMAASDGFEVTRSDTASADADASSSDGASAAAAKVFIHVSGAVVTPGVYELTEGARVQEAILAAGGFNEAAAANVLNLARVVADGEQIIVPTQEEIAAAQTAATAGSDATNGNTTTSSAIVGGKVNINTATAADLDTLPGVGASTAEKILADREANGPFATPEDLMRVSGIGDKKYAELSNKITVG